MIWVFAAVGLALVVVIALVAVGRETGRQAVRARPAVFDLEEAVDFIADALPADVAGRITHDDVRWLLRTDVDLLEEATDEDSGGRGPQVVDEDAAVARLMAAAEGAGRELSDDEIAAVLDARLRYLEAIGAVGPAVEGPQLD